LYRNKFYIVAILIVIILVSAGCGRSVEPNAESSGSDGKVSTAEDITESIILAGIGGEDIKVTIEEVEKLKKVSKDVISLSSDGGETELNASGGLLGELLEKHNITQTELDSIRVTAGDGYSMEIPSEILKNRDIILAYEINGESLFEEDKPIKIVIPGERAMYWVRNVAKIEIAKEETAVGKQVGKVLIFDTAISNLDMGDYEYYGERDKAIKTSDLLNKFIPEGEEQVFIKAADGLQRNETRETFKNAFIKVTGKESPMFLAPDLPEGMHIKGILWFRSEETAFLTMDKALETYSKSVQGDIEGISLKEVLEDMDLEQGNAYIFTADDGYSVEISKDDIDRGILYKMSNGSTGVSFEGLPKNTMVRDLLSIEAK
ncbi:MAG TPA: molybdopterin-dependent oxidoreductase, partial [Clostridia bacterium]|nr:molybdopterin-dependent oxidoreductase [Clostridia bacterium]